MIRTTGRYSAQIFVQGKRDLILWDTSINCKAALRGPAFKGATRSGSLKCKRNFYRYSTWHETTAFLVGSGFLHDAVPDSLVPLPPMLPCTCSTRMVGHEQLVRYSTRNIRPQGGTDQTLYSTTILPVRRRIERYLTIGHPPGRF